jgi:lysophospholipase L1-like esterase
MKSLHFLFAAALLFAAFALSSCSDQAPEGPVPGLGSNTVTKFVAIGNSLTAGYQSNALYASAQYYSFPRLMSLQLQLAGAPAASFEQPLWGDPGSPMAGTTIAARYEIISLVGPVIGPKGVAAGSLTNSALARPYDNLGIPGAVVFDLLDTTNFTTKAVARGNPFFLVVLRSSAMGASMLAQAKALRPDMVTFWLGANDVLGYATSGGVSPSSPTNAGVFGVLYSQAIDSLLSALPNAKIVVGNVPDVSAIPFFTTIGPKVKALLPTGVNLAYQMHGETGVGSGSSNLSGANPPFLCLTGSTYAGLLGRPTGQWYRDNRYPALPPGIDTTKPFGFHPQNPWPDALVLDAAEQTTASTAAINFNAAIAAKVAGNPRIAVADAYAFLNQLKTSGYSVSGITFTSAYVAGGVFSLDGVHPSSRGHGLMANLFIKAMNAKWGMSIPYVDIAAIPGILAPVSKAGENDIPRIPYEAFKDFEMLFGAHL